MPESRDLYAEVAMLRDQVDDMNRSVSALTRQSGLTEAILAAMGKDETLAHVFLAVDGVKTQKEIIEHLKVSGLAAGATRATVSRKIEILIDDWELVRPTGRNANGITYVHTSLARALKIQRALVKGLHKPKPSKSGTSK